ncbi:MAG: TPM domain-containing protein [Burkholderiaceae bacterium]
MTIQRIWRHFAMTQGRVHRSFSRATLSVIERTIKASETAHMGEIRFVVEGALDTAALFGGQSARERAIELFSQLRIWDTEHNSGVLIYLLLADRQVEIVADRGIHAKSGTHAWTTICGAMELAFKKSNFQDGAVQGIQAVTRQLTEHFPADIGDRNELSNKPLVL